MKKNNFLIILSISFIFLFLSCSYVFATSGACSSHGGVNCIYGRDWDGSVICNDGWIDSITSYDFTKKCNPGNLICQSYTWTDKSIYDVAINSLKKLKNTYTEFYNECLLSSNKSYNECFDRLNTWSENYKKIFRGTPENMYLADYNNQYNYMLNQCKENKRIAELDCDTDKTEIEMIQLCIDGTRYDDSVKQNFDNIVKNIQNNSAQNNFSNTNIVNKRCIKSTIDNFNLYYDYDTQKYYYDETCSAERDISLESELTYLYTNKCQDSIGWRSIITNVKKGATNTKQLENDLANMCKFNAKEKIEEKPVIKPESKPKNIPTPSSNLPKIQDLKKGLEQENIKPTSTPTTTVIFSDNKPKPEEPIIKNHKIADVFNKMGNTLKMYLKKLFIF